MGIDPELKCALSEARIANDAALIAAEQLAQHGVLESLNFDRLMSLLLDAQAALDRAHALTEEPGEDARQPGNILHLI